MATKINKNYGGSFYSPLVGSERMPTFTGVWQEEEAFIQDLEASPIPQKVTTETARTIFYLLYARYGNSTIASSDIFRFKTRIFSIIFQFAPTWEKRLEIQDNLRELTEEQIKTGSLQIYNDAENPTDIGEETGTRNDELLSYINRQNVTHNKKGVLEAYALLDSLLRADVTEAFLNRFQPLFLKFPNVCNELDYETF